jgi:hypothetical protein
MDSLLTIALSAAVAVQAHEPPIVQRVETQNVQPVPVVDFVPGPQLLPTADLRAWLDGQGAKAPRPMLRLPVVLAFDAEPGRGLARAWLGDQPLPREDAVLIAPDDGALGISLADRARELCAPDAPTCAMWLDGTWGPLVELPGQDPGDLPVFAVRSVHGLIAPGETIRAFIER